MKYIPPYLLGLVILFAAFKVDSYLGLLTAGVGLLFLVLMAAF